MGTVIEYIVNYIIIRENSLSFIFNVILINYLDNVQKVLPPWRHFIYKSDKYIS